MLGQSWRSVKVRRPRFVVEPYVQQLVNELRNANTRAEVHVAGSWRRGADVVGDIDLIVVTEDGLLAPSLVSVGVALPDQVRWDRCGAKVANGSVEMPDGSELHCDVWSLRPHERGAYLMFATGPATLNVIQRRYAARRGMALSQIGLLDRATRAQLDDGTEENIYELLGLPFLAPHERQRWA